MHVVISFELMWYSTCQQAYAAMCVYMCVCMRLNAKVECVFHGYMRVYNNTLESQKLTSCKISERTLRLERKI
uniref:Secreted protein n=1 Tax=Octopus bimaculoides TaxID=37653 RepID=A0A0L8GFH8_OCTBM